jgi:hypothetical protein
MAETFDGVLNAARRAIRAGEGLLRAGAPQAVQADTLLAEIRAQLG